MGVNFKLIIIMKEFLVKETTWIITCFLKFKNLLARLPISVNSGNNLEDVLIILLKKNKSGD